jgi:sulfoxide reductase heme-binding subunit YedZ
MLSRLSPYWLWLLLSVPALGMTTALFGNDARAFHRLLHPTGEFAAHSMIISMTATPLLYLTKGAGWARWLKANRRYFGVAAFFYAALRTYVYLVDESSLSRVLAQATHLDMFAGWAALHGWTGWPPALVHFAPLAVLTVYRLWWVYLRPRPSHPAV